MNPTQKSIQTARHLGLIGWATLFVAYTLIFVAFGDNGWGSSTQRALINTLPAALLSWPIVRLIERYVVDATLPKQIVLHLVLSLSFGLIWYIGIQVGYGLQNGLPANGIVGRPLIGVALTWQMYQGVTLYAVIAMFTYATTYRSRLTILEMQLKTAQTSKPVPNDVRQIFVKDGQSLRPVAFSDILCLSGAGDYTDVVTRDGTFLSATSLSGFEAELPKDGFLRVHRSHIVRTDAILSMESGGNGRLTLHLPKGQSVTTSRAGASRLKERAL